ncbi:MAG TPA: response regulator, partial [Polyangiaceae bacterium]|nr:response regulator [Polyangiaceae bacterium]
MPARPRILCVDDEPSVLDALSASLRRDHDVVAIAGASAALEALTRDPTIAVILSDLRMPGMDGATFLGKARAIAPDAARLLLVAQGELDLALAAMNEGRIFRFVIKPCT